MIANPPKVFHQLIEFFKRRAASALVSLSDQPQLFHNGDSVLEFLPWSVRTPFTRSYLMTRVLHVSVMGRK